MVIDKNLLGVLSIIICIAQYGPLLYLTLHRKKQPHIYTRFIWALTFGIACAGQYADHGSAGSWATGVSGLFCLAVALAAARGGKSYIRLSDSIALLAAVPLGIPF